MIYKDLRCNRGFIISATIKNFQSVLHKSNLAYQITQKMHIIFNALSAKVRYF